MARRQRSISPRLTESRPAYTPPVDPARSFLRSRIGARGLIIAGLLFFSFAFFYQGGGWNQNARFDLVRAIVEHHTLRIDAYHENTGDKALFDGHYYSDKAPAASFVAVPPVAAARGVLDAVGVDPNSEGTLTALSYLATLVAASAPAALTALAIYWLALRLGSSPGGAAFAAVSFGVATPVWAYATVLWGHTLAAALLFGGFAAAVSLRHQGGERRDFLLGAIVGLSVTFAALAEFTAALPAFLIASLAARHVWNRNVPRRARTIVALVAGAVPAGLVLVIYNSLAFGSPFELGYSYTVNFPNMREGLFGIGAPDLHVVKELLVGRYRGLLPLAPIVAVAPIGLYLLAKQRGTRASAAVAGFIPLYYLMVNAGYFDWSGGGSYGPRHLGVALPFLCLPVAIVWTRASRVPRLALSMLALVGASLSLVALSTTVIPPVDVRDPVSDLNWPAFREGRLSLNATAFYVDGEVFRPEVVDDSFDRKSWNLGERIGLAGHMSLVPLIALWTIAGVAWWWIGRARGRPRSVVLTQPVIPRGATPFRDAPPETPAGVH
jgi:hypothetical protein